MELNELAKAYLQPFATKTPFPPQVAYGNLIGVHEMDFSLASLDVVDHILDHIRHTDKPDAATFLHKQENQNFLLALCFYVGTTVAYQDKQSIAWLDYDTMIGEMPDNAANYPRIFQTAVTCVMDKSGWMVPLGAICGRLFDDQPLTGVKQSAMLFLQAKH